MPFLQTGVSLQVINRQFNTGLETVVHRLSKWPSHLFTRPVMDKLIGLFIGLSTWVRKIFAASLNYINVYKSLLFFFVIWDSYCVRQEITYGSLRRRHNNPTLLPKNIRLLNIFRTEINIKKMITCRTRQNGQFPMRSVVFSTQLILSHIHMQEGQRK